MEGLFNLWRFFVEDYLGKYLFNKCNLDFGKLGSFRSIGSFKSLGSFCVVLWLICFSYDDCDERFEM